jgi:hypothetical protein
MNLKDSKSMVISFKTKVDKEEIIGAIKLLEGLEVISDDFEPNAKFDRKALCGTWVEFPVSNLNMRDLILLRDIDNDYFYVDKRPKFYNAPLFDPYLQKQIYYTTGETNEDQKADVDHIVSLSNAYKCGAWKWSKESSKFQSLANELINLITVSATVNKQKGDKDATEWLPVLAFQKRFIVLQIFVKSLYELSVTSSEKQTMLKILNS